MKQLRLFSVRSNTLTYPVFYVEASDILEATRKAKELVATINDEKEVESVSITNIPLLELEDE